MIQNPNVDTISFQSQSDANLHACRSDLKIDRRAVAMIGAEDIQIGREVGAGNYSQVYEVDVVARFLDDSEEEKAECSRNDFHEKSICSDRNLGTFFSPSRSSRESLTRSRYALKRLKTVYSSQDKAVACKKQEIAVRDFLVEAEMLSKLPLHPHIIRIAALSQDFFQCPQSGFFVLDLLEETLEGRLVRHKKLQTQKNHKVWSLNFLCSKNNRDEEYLLRDCGALGIVKALQHLHYHNVVYRDLKPTNIGFCAAGTVKLFDFGLARTCSQDKKLTGGAGTLRYMAPEVALHECYGLSADVYSTGLLLWQICTLRKPLAHITKMDEWYKSVVDHKSRPPLTGIELPRVRKLIAKCWQENPQHRPQMNEVALELEKAINFGGP